MAFQTDLAPDMMLMAVQIYGIKYGLRGFYSRDAKPMELNARAVEGIHLQGGTVLVSLCSPQPVPGSID